MCSTLLSAICVKYIIWRDWNATYELGLNSQSVY